MPLPLPPGLRCRSALSSMNLGMRLLPYARLCRSLGNKPRTRLLHVHPPSFAAVRWHSKMAGRTYNDAIECLNSLQTPAAVLKQRRDAGIRIDKTANEQMRRYLHLLGYTQEDLERLNIVHVAGTKGKGSTCAYVDSILFQYRASRGGHPKVGLFTSPHLIAVRERIRINSSPISEGLFARYFFEVWDKLEAAVAEKPVYFRYLTLMSYHVFIQQGVDVAIYEVGVGGEYDSTNVVDKPAVTGISHLGIDHTYTLGNTIEEIAWHKAGIQKEYVPSFTVHQETKAQRVVIDRSQEKKVQSLRILGVDPRLDGVHIRPNADFQRFNASLAIALAGEVLSKIGILDWRYDYDTVRPLPEEFIDGLEKVVWRGRCEMKREDNITWYLDGAHTPHSMIVAAKWFNDASLNDQSGPRVLIFNQQGERDAFDLLENLYKTIESDVVDDSDGSDERLLPKFDHIIFCPTVLGGDSTKKDFEDKSLDPDEVAKLGLQKEFKKKWKELDDFIVDVKVYPTITHAIDFVRLLGEGDDGEGQEVSVLVTGSVRLVGAALSVLEGPGAL